MKTQRNVNRMALEVVSDRSRWGGNDLRMHVGHVSDAYQLGLRYASDAGRDAQIHVAFRVGVTSG